MMRMKRTNACSYALTWVDVGFKAISSSISSAHASNTFGNHRSVAVAAIQSTSTIMVRMHGFIHVLQRRNETHERMFLHIGMFLRMFSNLLNTGCGRGVRLWALDTADIFGLVT